MLKKFFYAYRSFIHKYDGRHNNCPSCGSSSFREIQAKFFRKYPTSLRHCSKCRLLYRHPTTLEVESKKFYEEDYVQHGLTTDLPDEQTLQNLLDTNFVNTEKDAQKWLPLFEGISKKMNRKIRILDYGANWGYTLHQLQTQDYFEEVIGYEYSNKMRVYGERNLNVSYISDSDFTNQFDVVFSSHVIEHMHNPSLFKSHVDQLLVQGGYAIVTCPNGSMTALFEDPVSWRNLWGEVHPNFISDEYLLSQFEDYEGAVFSEIPEKLAEFSYIDHLTSPPSSYLPASNTLIGIFRSMRSTVRRG